MQLSRDCQQGGCGGLNMLRTALVSGQAGLMCYLHHLGIYDCCVRTLASKCFGCVQAHAD